MLVIGLTGGIGSGKSAVASRFAGYGVPVVDADSISRELTATGNPVLEEIVQCFGSEHLQPDGSLNRQRLRNTIFADPEARLQLQAIMHPHIRQIIQQRLKELDSAYCLVVIPLLVETGQRDLVDRVLVTECPLELRYQRLAERDGASREQVDQVLAAQSDADSRSEAADDIIINNGSWGHLYAQVDALHHRYLTLAPRFQKG